MNGFKMIRGDRKLSFKYGRFLGISIVLMMSAMALSALVPVVEEAGGYANYNFYAPGSSSGALTGYVENDYYYGSNSYYSGSYSYGIGGGYYYSSSYYYYYRGWIPIPVSNIDPDTLINQITFYFRVASLGYSQGHEIYMLKFDPRDKLGQPEDLFNSIDSNSYYIGYQYVSSYTTYSVSTTSGTIFNWLKNWIGSGNEYLFFGIVGSTYYGYNSFYANSNTYMTITGDMEPPNEPLPYSLNTYTTSASVPLDWADVSDRPSGTNHGGVKYKVGAFSSTSTDSLTWSSEWTSSSNYNVYGLNEGTWYFRLKAKDAGDFETGWSSSYTSTLIDRTPPTAPLLVGVSPYTNGTTLALSWVSQEFGSGMQNYGVIYATEADFSDQDSYLVNGGYNSWPHTLTANSDNYITMMAIDRAGLQSAFTPIVKTYSDTAPPTVPVMMAEPPYTKGDNNTFQWHPSVDDGIGVDHYKIQVATAGNFNPGSIVRDFDTEETLAYFEGLQDDTRYYARVQAVDGFHHESAWSEVEWTIQDHRGPGELGLVPLMEYQPVGPVHLEWAGAEDQGAGVGWYEVLWSTDPMFNTGVHSKDHVLGQTFQIPSLAPDTTWYIKVRSYDTLGNPGQEEEAYTTIDSQPPTQPEIDPLDEFSGGSSVHLTWSESPDTLSGFDHFILNVYTSPDRVGLAFTVHTTGLEFTVPGLSDGTTYYYEVMAVDRAGNRIASELVHSTQDTKGPDTPGLLPMEKLQSSGLVQIKWAPCEDGGGGVVEYQVQWATDLLFTEDVQESPWTDLTGFEIYDTDGGTRADGKTPLSDGEYFIRLRSKDQFDQMSPWGNSVNVIVDTTSPTTPVLQEVPEYSGGSMVHLAWEASEDTGDGSIEYRVRVSLNETGDPIMVTPWTKATNIDVTGLKPDSTYYFRVVARDGLGWISAPSDPETTTMDVNPPTVHLDGKGVFGGADLFVHGTVVDLGCGVKKVEYSYNSGQSWQEAPLVSEKWSFPISLLPDGTKEVHVRGHDSGGNIGSPISAFVDNILPEISITSPEDGDRITGMVQITGSVRDDHLSTYKVEYKRTGLEDWKVIVPEEAASSASGILATWVPSNIPGGVYMLRVTAKDVLGQTSARIVNVTIAGAMLAIDPSQITFSNPNPMPGEKVTVYVTITNFGDSQAEDITLKLYDDGDEIFSQTGIRVPANGITVISAEIEVTGEHFITARATSDLYDTGAMEEPATIRAMEEEMILEDFGGIASMIAIVLALIAIILAFILASRKGKEKPKKEDKKKKMEEMEEKEIESTPPVQTPPPSKPSLPQPQTPPSRPQLPQPQAQPSRPQLPQPQAQPQQQPQLPSPTTPPAPAPPTPQASAPTPPKPPAPIGNVPQQQATPQGTPMLKAAPAPQATYSAPKKNGQQAPEVSLPDL
ncbi:MAG: fibronectin type III domain-containing protein [Thermoplasmatota archaeon]